MEGLFIDGDQFKDWKALSRAIEASDEIVPCTNFPDAWYPMSEFGATPELKMAKNLCKTACPVVTECLVYGLKHEEHGVWGGTTAGEREQLRRRGNIRMTRKAYRTNDII